MRQPPKLVIVREVLEGRLRRKFVCVMPMPERVWVAVAIILATGDRYLEPDGVVKRPLARIYSELVSPHSSAAEGAGLVAASCGEQLHTSTWHSSREAYTFELTPPPELLSLIEELADMPGLEPFLQEVEAQGIG